MVVALNSDASVRRQGKGDERPVNTLADRLAVIAALGCVTLVTWFDEDTPLQRIIDCRPDILVKGGDWPVAKIVGGNRSCRLGRNVHSIPFIHKNRPPPCWKRSAASSRKNRRMTNLNDMSSPTAEQLLQAHQRAKAIPR
jgi:hypothetical protein